MKVCFLFRRSHMPEAKASFEILIDRMELKTFPRGFKEMLNVRRRC